MENIAFVLGNGTSRLLDTNTKEENEHNRRVFKLSSTIDDREWRELWNIFKGQSILDYKKLLKIVDLKAHSKKTKRKEIKTNLLYI